MISTMTAQRIFAITCLGALAFSVPFIASMRLPSPMSTMQAQHLWLLTWIVVGLDLGIPFLAYTLRMLEKEIAECAKSRK